MDQLYTYQILQQLKEKSFNDEWGLALGIVIQGLILWFTIKYSVKLSKEEFERNQQTEIKKTKNEKARFRKVIIRNINKVLDQVVIDEQKFRTAFIDGYNIENGIRTVQAIILFPELDMLKSIDKLKFEDYFLENSTDENDISNLYYGISGIDGAFDSYEIIKSEISKINDFIGSYETILLQEHNKIHDFIKIKVDETIGFNDIKENKSDVKLEDIENMFIAFETYESKINNFKILNDNLESFEKTNGFEIYIKPYLLDYIMLKNNFHIYYLKYVQEVELFHERIEYHILRLKRCRANLELILKLNEKLPK
ncbi:hypothetical protein [Sphingobacterium sp.]|uniref:hypothetical protein n=1 Tax=Sphingobacterium sp. TaxID=341027 RepID=UPI0028AB7D9E|nr:hypothetical protein [Sphingobacterium sp.]